MKKRTVVGALVLIFSLLCSVAPAGAADGIKVVVTPSTGLTNGAVVSVSGLRFAASQPVVAITQCNKKVARIGLAACNADPATVGQPGHPLVTSSNRRGKVGPVNYTVITGAVGNYTCGTETRDTTCYIAVAVIDPGTGMPVPGQTGFAKITFPAPPG